MQGAPRPGGSRAEPWPCLPSSVLALIFVAATLPATAFWTMTGVGAARLLRTERGLRAFNIATAILLVGSLLMLLLEG